MAITDFYQKDVFLDTAPLIYFIEEHSIYQAQLLEYFSANDNGDLNFITSSITLLEVLVKHLKEGKSNLVSKYKKILLSAPGIQTFDITGYTVRCWGQHRTVYPISNQRK